MGLNPGLAEARADLALILASSRNPDLRNGPQAVEFATRACDQTAHRAVKPLAAVAAAQAEIGDFDRAIATIDAARQLPDPDPAGRIALESMLRSFQERQPFRFPSPR